MPDTLPIHPRTGLRAVGIVAGHPVWPIKGGSSPEPPPALTDPAPPVAQQEAPQPEANPALGDGGIKALEAERKARAAAEKQAKTLADRLQKLEDKDKTDLERAQARVAELEQSYAAAEAQRLRLHVATTHNVGADDLILLTGTTEEELTAQATRIAALNVNRATATAAPAFAPSPAQQAGNGTPVAPAATVDSGRQLYLKNKAKTA